MNTTKNSPWGNLVGIRPVKRVVKMMQDGLSDNEITRVLKNDFFVSDKKIDLAMSIAKTELKVMKTIPENLLETYAPAMSAIEQVRPEATMKDFSQTRDLIKSIKSST